MVIERIGGLHPPPGLPGRVGWPSWLGVAFIALTFLACKGSRGGPGEPVKTVTIGYLANLTHAQAVLGVASGEFARAVAPAKFQTKVFNAGPSAVEALFAGDIDIAYIGPGPALSAHDRSKGKGIRVIAGAAANGVVVVARKGSGVRSMADLAGKRVATPQLGNTQDLSARHYVTYELGRADAKNVLPVPNAEQGAMMERGQIDAAWVPEPWGQRLVDEVGAEIVAEERDLWPDRDFCLTLVVTTPEFLSAHPDAVESVVRVHRAWTGRLASEPERHIPALADAMFGLTGKRLPEGTLRAAMKRIKFTDEPLEGSLSTFARWAHDLEPSRSQVDVAGLVDTSVLRRVAVSRADQGGPESK